MTRSDDELPPHLANGVIDAVLFCHEDDKPHALAFTDTLTKKAAEKRKLLEVYLYDKLIYETSGQPENKCIEQMCMYAVLVIFYITENLLRDDNLLFHKNEHIMKSLKTKNFIPIWVKKNRSEYDDLPYGLGQFRGASDQGPRALQILTNMLELPVYKKRRAELKEKHTKDCEAWKMEEKSRRQYTARRPSSPMSDVESEMPSYLVEGMHAAEEALAAVIYNIIIHDPEQVVIGNNSGAIVNIDIVETDTDQ